MPREMPGGQVPRLMCQGTCPPGTKRGGNIKSLSSYMMLVGILLIAFSGNWIIENYDLVSIYPKTAYITFGIGWFSAICAYVMNRHSEYKEKPSKKDNRDLINKWGSKKTTGFEKGLIGIAILTLIIVAFYNWSLTMRLLGLFLFIGIVFIGFLYVMKGDREEEPDDLDFKGKTKKFLDLIDYRRHPFNLSLIIFSLVIGSFVLSKQYGIPLALETGGNPRYVTSLPSIAFVMSGLMVICSYIYIINNGDIFGIRKTKQNGLKVLQIHFAEIIICGVSFAFWLVTVFEALILHF